MSGVENEMWKRIRLVFVANHLRVAQIRVSLSLSLSLSPFLSDSKLTGTKKRDQIGRKEKCRAHARGQSPGTRRREPQANCGLDIQLRPPHVVPHWPLDWRLALAVVVVDADLLMNLESIVCLPVTSLALSFWRPRSKPFL